VNKEKIDFENIAKFRDLVSSMTDEYMSKDGIVTCEFSTDLISIDIKLECLKQASKKLKIGKWVIYKCDTCKSYHKDKQYHVEIIKDN
jgi:hypothetical protein